jgi:MFS family permease
MRATAIPEMLNIPNLADEVGERLRIRARATGVLVMSGFGALWSGAGLALSSAPAWAWAMLAIVSLAFGVRALHLLRTTPPPIRPLPADISLRKRRGDRIFAWTTVGEGLGILLAINVVSTLGHPQWQPAAAMVVVGLHFLPQSTAYAYPPHLVTGVAMTAWALAYPWLFAAGAMAPAGMLGAGAILFASAAWALRSVAAR